ncbi:PLP-dependent aminotransferase family protein [Paenibacillus sacheonensis]|uniref:Aminotransferase class I/II-fold pyridoxal phosphate-dependent enzyme n=1 Tax=Paenibacillus sacheonensis TaxID=742054 RepID=A0A7X4YSF2_9BACL|nr:PLP-dependent aminotransferase family protein [Paenibacillus sacheonensis]MBM7566734.1 GntR family transcriptional regulator/MocR family aminotransferase [Paenibacillus sacheonensis]NBC71690.1 aminotransferase class I/II-fold pyridoxal phosphate-dependent enzyme [Paenibacillus sacheonensis]
MDIDFRMAYERYYEELGRKTEAVFQALRENIVNGTLPPGTRLPSSRKLADLYGLSRGSVNAAYDMLIAEGFARAEGGSGTFVSFGVPLQGSGNASGKPAGAAPLALSAWGERLVVSKERFSFIESHPLNPNDGLRAGISFRLRETESNLFPAGEWKSALYAEIRDMMEAFPAITAPPDGYLPLREAIAHDLRRERGIRADAASVMITNGSMQAIALLSMLLVEPGMPVVVENPSYSGIKRAITAQGGTLLAAAVDDHGIVPANWEANLLLVTPTRQFPTGAVLSASRRAQLLAWASRRGAVIVEDDYDSELRWGGRPVEPLKALDREGRVVYIGTFSKTMFVDLRLGYVVLPNSLQEPFRLAKALLEPHPSALVEQRAMARFIGGGAYAKHVRRMKRIIGRRLRTFQEEVDARLARWFRFVPADAGLHMFAEWRGDARRYAVLRERCAERGVDWSVGDSLWEGGAPRCSALFGFAHLREEQIVRGGAIIEAACIELDRG